MLYRNRPRNDTNESNDAKNFKSNSGSFTPEYDQQLKKDSAFQKMYRNTKHMPQKLTCLRINGVGFHLQLARHWFMTITII